MEAFDRSLTKLGSYYGWRAFKDCSLLFFQKQLNLFTVLGTVNGVLGMMQLGRGERAVQGTGALSPPARPAELGGPLALRLECGQSSGFLCI